jgi:hypothetical protein
MADFNITDGGSVVLIEPTTDDARTWVDEHIGEDNGFQPYYPTVVAERRYAGDIISGIQADGFEVA